MCIRDRIWPRDHQLWFKLSFVASMSGAQLKEHVIRLSEMWVVVLSLFLGASTQLWGLLPETGVGDGARQGFECVSFFCCIQQLFSVVSNAVFIVVSSAVPARNFVPFWSVCLGQYQLVEGFTLLGSYAFVVQILILGYTKLDIVCSGSNDWLPETMLAISLAGIPVFVFVVNSVSVVAQHGGLFADHIVVDCTGSEDEIRAGVLSNIVSLQSDQQVQNFYHRRKVGAQASVNTQSLEQEDSKSPQQCDDSGEPEAQLTMGTTATPTIPG
eukprot:TRINITY_DN15162_c0_g1_i1.p1 TRINITY_DN15162_c0_g1~~TRINITY_DN15162_c0_g1_i1.p1  ORF type:complete len:270 (-),score=55.89 TRINITY_DN15162_c0_g1_i1:223-1032(-)